LEKVSLNCFVLWVLKVLFFDYHLETKIFQMWRMCLRQQLKIDIKQKRSKFKTEISKFFSENCCESIQCNLQWVYKSLDDWPEKTRYFKANAFFTILQIFIKPNTKPESIQGVPKIFIFRWWFFVILLNTLLWNWNYLGTL